MTMTIDYDQRLQEIIEGVKNLQVGYIVTREEFDKVKQKNEWSSQI